MIILFLFLAMASENFAGIDFDEIKEATALEVDEIKVLKLCFNLFDVKKQDFLGSDDLVSDAGWDPDGAGRGGRGAPRQAAQSA
jgi:hypothetical protein